MLIDLSLQAKGNGGLESQYMWACEDGGFWMVGLHLKFLRNVRKTWASPHNRLGGSFVRGLPCLLSLETHVLGHLAILWQNFLICWSVLYRLTYFYELVLGLPLFTDCRFTRINTKSYMPPPPGLQRFALKNKKVLSQYSIFYLNLRLTH